MPVMGTLTDVVEGPANRSRSILVGTCRVIITMTTAGFGGIPPKTDLRRVITSVMMLIGWGTRAVPTGIAGTAFSARRIHREPTMRTCHERLSEGHLPGARFRRDCGAVGPAWQRDAGGVA